MHPLPPPPRRSLSALAALAVALFAPTLRADGPGFTQPTGRQPGDILSTWTLGAGARTTNIGFHRGYLFTHSRGILAGAPGEAGAAVQVWNISNLSSPVRVGNQLNIGYPQHNFYMTGDRYANALARNNPTSTFWDFSNMLAITASTSVPYQKIPRGRRDWIAAPYAYIGQNGYHTGNPTGTIYDMRDGSTVGVLDYEADLGFLAKPFVIGNLLLAVSVHAEGGVAAYDISDPAAPRLLDILPSSAPDGTTLAGRGYEPCVYKHYIVLGSDFNEGSNEIRFVDFSDPQNLRLAAVIPDALGTNRYIQFQDTNMFAGDVKYDLSAFPTITPTLIFDGFDEYNFPLGNLLVTGSPDAGEARILVHQAAPDTAGPTVAYHVPAADAGGQALTTRIGLVIHESLDALSLNDQTVRLRPLGGAPLAGTVSLSDSDVVTFHPTAPLLPDTVYEVVLPADGIRDLAGNAIASEFLFRFSTGDPVELGNRAPRIDAFAVSAYPAAPGAPVTLSATVSDPDGDALEARWDFGDGTPPTDWTTDFAPVHTYATEGHHRGTVQVRDPSDAVITRSFTVTVSLPPPATAGLGSSVIVHHAGSDRILGVNPDHGTVSAFSAATSAKVFETAVGRRPESVAVDAYGFAWVACREDARLDRVRVSDGLRLDSLLLPSGSAPHGLLFDHAGTTGYVTLSGSGELLRFDPLGRAITGRLPAGPGPRALALSADGATVHVARFVSPDSGAEVRAFTTSPFAPAGSMVYPVFTDASFENGANGRGLPNYLVALLPDARDHRVWIAAKKDNILRGTARDGLPLTFETSVRSLLAPFAPAAAGSPPVALPAEALDLDNSAPPAALAFSPLGDYLFTASQGNNEVEVIDAFTRAHVARFATGLAPHGLAFDPVRRRLWVSNFTGRTVTVLDLAGFLEFGSPSLPAPVTVDATAAEPLTPAELRGKQIFYSAKDVDDADLNPSRMSLDSYLSCAVCHLDGGHDGRVWDFTDRGEGLRNTIDLRGRAGLGHGALHWSANFDEVQDFENDIRGEFGGTGFLPDADWADPEIRAPLGPKPKSGRSADLDALAAYVSSLAQASLPRSPHREPDGRLGSEALRGLAVFQTASCTDCHIGVRFTDGLAHDVGTLRVSSGGRLGGPLTAIDTPTLLGLFDSAPYLHDGSAPTLDSVFDRFDPAAAPGSVRRAHDLSAFSAADRAALVRYLHELDGHDLHVPNVVAPDGQPIELEAESGQFAAGQTVWTVTTNDTSASGDGRIHSTLSNIANYPSSSAAARIVVYPFSVTAPGDHALYARVNGPSASQDSFFFRLLRPDGTRTEWTRWNNLFTNTGASWQWKRLGVDGTADRPPTTVGDLDFLGLAVGAYALEITYREPNLLIDKFVIQPAGAPAPTGFGSTPITEPDPLAWYHEPLPSDFATWAARSGLPAGTTFTTLLPSGSTPAGLAYALGSDAALPRLEASGPALIYEFERDTSRSHVRYTVQASPDLAVWTDVATAAPGAASMTNLVPEDYVLAEETDPRAPGRVRATLGTSPTERIFLRLVVIPTAP
jgi:YVTN family beta-propeller protein